MKKTIPLSDKDHTLISCRRVIARLLDPNFELTEAFQSYAEMVMREARAVLEPTAWEVADDEL